MKRKYNWIKPIEKKIYPLDNDSIKPILPTIVDFRNDYKLPKCYNQGNLGSCTSNALGFAHQFIQIKNNNYYKFRPSRLYLYYKQRARENSINSDDGSYISTGVKVLKKNGVCKESLWPYIIRKFKIAPSKKANLEALKFKVNSVYPINDNIQQIKTNLYNRFPVVFGFLVYESFESKTTTKTGIMTMPNFSKEELLGGHAVVAIGYNDNTKCVICRNSWGSKWGDNGYFYMPYNYITNGKLCDEFYVIKNITNPKQKKQNKSVIIKLIKNLKNPTRKKQNKYVVIKLIKKAIDSKYKKQKIIKIKLTNKITTIK